MYNDIIYISLIMVGISLIFLFGLTTFVVCSNNKHRKRLEEIAKYQINVTATIDGNIPEILNLIIKESFDDYIVRELIPKNEGHINSDREAEIRKALVGVVSSRISSATLDKLSLYYNIENIASILADKIYISVMNYVLKHNAEVSNSNEKIISPK